MVVDELYEDKLKQEELAVVNDSNGYVPQMQTGN